MLQPPLSLFTLIPLSTFPAKQQTLDLSVKARLLPPLDAEKVLYLIIWVNPFVGPLSLWSSRLVGVEAFVVQLVC